MLRRNDGHVLRKALEFEVKGKRKRGLTTKEDLEDASGGEQQCWFGEGGCLESSGWRVGIGEIPFMGINPDQNWIDDDNG